jgi:hypothetical protein
MLMFINVYIKPNITSNKVSFLFSEPVTPNEVAQQFDVGKELHIGTVTFRNNSRTSLYVID